MVKKNMEQSKFALCVFCEKKSINKDSKFFCSPQCHQSTRHLLKGLYSSSLSRKELMLLTKREKKKLLDGSKKKPRTVEQIEEEQIERLTQQVKFLGKALNQERAKKVTQLNLITMVTGAIAAVPEPKFPPYKPPRVKMSRESQAAVLQLSDLHIGEIDRTVETNAPGYDFDVFCNELQILKRKVLRIVEHHRMISPVPKLVMFWKGDFVCGHEVFPGQSWRTELDVLLQVLSGTTKLVEFVTEVSYFFEEVLIVCVPGNHGALRGKQPAPMHVNWDFLLYHMVRKWLENNTRVKMVISPSWWTIQKIGPWSFYVDHGATFGRRWMGIPLYGIKRASGEMRRTLDVMREMSKSQIQTIDRANPEIQKILKECAPHLLASDLHFDHILLGHNHETFFWRGILGNGAFSRGNYYALKQFQAINIPEQNLFGVHPQVGISWFYPLRLDLEIEE